MRTAYDVQLHLVGVRYPSVGVGIFCETGDVEMRMNCETAVAFLSRPLHRIKESAQSIIESSKIKMTLISLNYSPF